MIICDSECIGTYGKEFKEHKDNSEYHFMLFQGKVTPLNVDLFKLSALQFSEVLSSGEGNKNELKYYDFFIKDFDGHFKTRDSL